MLTPRDRQRSFYDADEVCERLIPEDSFYRKFRQIVSPLIDDSMFESMYCLDNGRPPISPSLIAMACILQFYRNLSDRDMERACMYDIEVKYALGLRLDERPFDHSSLGDFRKRLLENGKEKELFDRILAELVDKGLIKKDEVQRIDATHVIADIAIPNIVTLIKKSIREIIKTLSKRHKEVLKQIASEIDLSMYGRQTVNQAEEGRMDLEKRSALLVDVVADAWLVVGYTKDIEGDHILKRRVDTLRQILRENIDSDDEGKPKEITKKDKPPDIMVSPVDPDARYGAKSPTKKFTGYKANVTETVKSRFITSITAMRGNRPDGETMVEAITGQREHGIVPKKLVGDSAYGDARGRRDLSVNGTKVIAPLKARKEKQQSIYHVSKFKYNEEENTLTCPAGVTAVPSYYESQKEMITFHFPMSVCRQCRRRNRCTTAREGRRTVGLGAGHLQLREAEQYSKGKRFKKDMRLRSPVEGKLSELIRWHGMRRARYRGLNKVALQLYFTAAAVNIKRWIKLELEKSHPKWSTVGA